MFRAREAGSGTRAVGHAAHDVLEAEIRAIDKVLDMPAQKNPTFARVARSAGEAPPRRGGASRRAPTPCGR